MFGCTSLSLTAELMGKRHTMRANTGWVKVFGFTGKFTFNTKEGIDNPVMVITDDADSVLSPGPRLCVLKREEGESYGFHLRVEKGRRGHIIRNVVSAGVGERSGLRDGDRLLEVNNCFVDDVSHPEVSRKMKLSGQQLCLLVLDEEAYERAVLGGKDLRELVEAHKGKGTKPARLCHITRNPASGLGISFTPVEGEKGQFSVSLVSGGAAEKAGVRKGDRLVWMNGATVSDLSASALNRMLKKCGNHITILVIDSESEKNHVRQGIPILPTMAVPHNLPFRTRKLHLRSGPEGYGFLLRLERTQPRRMRHVLRDMDQGGPAERAGVKDGELLLEINGESVETLSHEDVVEKMRKSTQVTLTTITAQGLEFYTQLGLPPLLFCEDTTAAEEEKVSVGGKSSHRDTDDLPKPRLCSLRKGPLGFGFNLGCGPQSPGTFISQLAFGGSGQSAGLRVGDVVIDVNGQNVEEKSLEDVIMLVKRGGHFLSLSVLDETSYSKMKKNETPTRDIITEQEDEDEELTYL